MRILIIGDYNSYISTAAKIAHRLGASVTHVPRCDQALDHIRNKGADLIFIDTNADIKQFIGQLLSERCTVPVMAYGINADPSAARAAIQAGARDYVPFPPQPELIGAILASISEDKISYIAHDKRTQDLFRLAERIATSDASVLITGESGTGKEVIARFIHSKSRRSKHPFVSINCAAIPEALLESELFGYEKGAFTGAVARRIGKFEEAMGGTLLLDEVTEMSVALQAKLLRALQERVIERIGSNKPIPVDIRILATSNRNLDDAINNQLFREDLYYRLNVISIALPALRERSTDILPLAHFLIDKYCKLNGFEQKHLSPSAASKLIQYAWPGNVRELENIIHRAILLSPSDRIDIELPTFQGSGLHDTRQASSDRVKELADSALLSCVGRTLEDVERDLILKTLNSVSGNRTHAAQILGISIRTLRNKLNEYVQTGYFSSPHSELAT